MIIYLLEVNTTDIAIASKIVLFDEPSNKWSLTSEIE